jgi:geranylgeranyl pyrophosphate synthase
MPLSSVLDPIRPDLERVEEILRETLAGAGGPLRPLLSSVLAGGKRLRPAVVILSGQVFAPSTAAIHSLAAAVDMLHAATLIHDDVVDDAGLRRGRQALHTVWPAAASILAGDYLLGEAVARVADLGDAGIVHIFGRLLRTVCAGEVGQMLAGRGMRRGRQEYYESIEAKTASFFAASAQMAGRLAGASPAQVAALARFGRELGLAFQIVDDVLDLAGDEAELGKPAGSDLRQGLLTLPVLIYLEQGDAGGAVGAVLAAQPDEGALTAAIRAIRSSGAIEVALEVARSHVRRSREALAALPDHPSKELLGALAGCIVERRR